ncbi:ATP-binding protein [Balneolaceae bacterium ANBcel3]|nr:ATP-binding protein [Balneolaceae bacterium ANBcel3]
MAPPKKHSLQAGASTNELEQIRNFVSDIAKQAGFGEEQVHDIRLAVDEACTNIIKHAYQWDKNNTIGVQVSYHDNKLHIAIKDNGKAFDPDHYQVPTPREQLEKKKRSGYGVLLMRTLMDTVEYEKNRTGNILRMTKKR